MDPAINTGGGFQSKINKNTIFLGYGVEYRDMAAWYDDFWRSYIPMRHWNYH